jgi:hypothetical protein
MLPERSWRKGANHRRRLIKFLPLPLRRVIGDLSKTEKNFGGAGLKKLK